MKRFLIVLVLLFTPFFAKAEILQVETNWNMQNFWEKNGKIEEKVLTVGSHILSENKLKKRVPITVIKENKIINAFSSRYTKEVKISQGFLPYIDNDDELAFVISHEIAHSLDAYDGYFKWLAMNFNSKSYEYKADLVGVDLMVKAGYNPIAAITVSNKIFPEPQSDWGIWQTHPKGSKRLMKIYQYIYRKYPSYLSSSMVKNINYINFTYSSEKEINSFKQKEKQRMQKRGESL